MKKMLTLVLGLVLGSSMLMAAGCTMKQEEAQNAPVMETPVGAAAAVTPAADMTPGMVATPAGEEAAPAE